MLIKELLLLVEATDKPLSITLSLAKCIALANRKYINTRIFAKDNKISFKSRKLDINLLAELYREDGKLFVHFNDDGATGMSGNDPVADFCRTFTKIVKDAEESAEQIKSSDTDNSFR